MTAIDIYNLEGEKISQLDLNDKIFNVPIKKHVLHQVVLSQLAGKRSGSVSTKGRSQIKGSGKKLYRQKGTGRARVGAASSPTRRGGGVAFGPKPRNYAHKISKKIRKAAVCMALSDKVQSDQLIVLQDFDLEKIKTKEFVRVMNRFEVHKALIVIEEKNENLERSSKNVPWIKVMRYPGLNVYDILNYDHLFLLASAIPMVEEALVS